MNGENTMDIGDEIIRLKRVERCESSSTGVPRMSHILYLAQGVRKTNTEKTSRPELTLVWSVNYRENHPPDVA